MERKNTGKKHNQDFKKVVVDLYHSGSSIKELSNEYGVSEVTIYKWFKQFTPLEASNGESFTPDEVTKMQKQLLRLQGENEILKRLSL